METTSWIITILIFSTIHGICTWKMYEKAGKDKLTAFIPIYNLAQMLKIINRPVWWLLLFFLPIVNLLILPTFWIEILRTFGKKSTKDMWLGVLTFGLYIGKVNYLDELTYEPNRSTKAATKALDTLGSLAFALSIATFVHTYFIQPMVIPTPSLEKTLLVGDFLFVSKFHYGPKTPKTAVQVPVFVHDTLPIVKTKSYLSWPEYPSFRLPGTGKVQRNDIVCFNWPVDTVSKFFVKPDKFYYKPVDKKSNYVKRCVGIAGDEIQIKNGDLFVNGKPAVYPNRTKIQYSYMVKLDLVKNPNIDLSELIKTSGCTEPPQENAQDSTILLRALTNEGVEALKQMSGVKSITKLTYPPQNEDIMSMVFPKTKPNWSQDNMGPIKIPKAGDVVQLNKQTLPFYEMIIRNYEGNTLDKSNGQIKINGKPANNYTIKQNYYWMMGDNRHNSEDSRYWGFVPEDHVIGKPIFIWMSFDINNVFQKGFFQRFRTERIMTTVSGEGEPVSYFKYFLVFLVIYLIWDYFNAKKKKKKAEKTI